MTIAVRFMISSALSVLIAVLVMTILFTVFLNNRFRSYISMEKIEVRNELVRNMTAHLQENRTLDHEWLSEISALYMDQGLYITLNSAEGEQMWSCMDEENCTMHLNENDPEFFSHLETSSYEISGGPGTVQSLSLNVSYDPDESFSQNDRFFLRESFRMLLVSMILALATSSLASVGFARALSLPLRVLTGYALKLAGHDYSARDDYAGGTKEIDQLHDSIDQLARSLASQEELRKRLTGDVSHELRTPLTKIQSTMEAMIDGIWPLDAEHLQICHREILRLTGLVSQLDDLNRYDSGQELLHMKRMNLKDSLEYVTQMYRAECGDRNISLDMDLEDVFILGDEEKLKQVWINLMSNALKFTDNGGTIGISLTCEKQAVLRFSDTGTGLDPADIPLIFERFYKADTSRNAAGTGLGLSIVKEIVSMHGGTVKAESGLKSGTVFKITLPAA